MYHAEPVEYEDFEEDDDVIDLRAFEVVGGIIDFNLINMPPQPKQADKWTIVQSECFTIMFSFQVPFSVRVRCCVSVSVVDPPILEFNDYEGDPLPETPKPSQEVADDLSKAADKLLR